MIDPLTLHSILLAISQSLAGIFSASTGEFVELITAYGYGAVFLLMLLEGSGLPVPSEVVIPVVGYLSEKGVLRPEFGFAAIFLGTTGGLIVDYYIGYYLEKDVVYRHLRFFHIKPETLDAFDAWFKRNGPFSVFIARFMPEIRTLVSVPAGFAKMPLKQFFAFSLAGTGIWDVALMAYGYYLGTQSTSITILFASVGVFVVALYLVYAHFTRRIESGGTASASRRRRKT